MKKYLVFGLLLFLFACDDGDLQIETIDFEVGDIQFCTTPTIDVALILFKINSETNEALILELPKGLLKNEVSTAPIESTVSSSQSKLTYRSFSDNVSKDYFCDNIPPLEPTVTGEIIATDGTVNITTTLAEDGVSYDHNIELIEITLLKTDGSRITDLRIQDFGTVTTK